MPDDGRLLFARYALPPNLLGYCGGPDSLTLLEYASEGVTDPGLDVLLRQFQAAYPYVLFIAHASGLRDPLHPRAVEAYWLGNELLDRLEARRFYDFLEERFASRIPPRARRYFLPKVPRGARPHHSFHVLEVSLLTGALEQSLQVLDRCRISWGVVGAVEGEWALVQYRPLVLREGRLALGEPVERRVRTALNGLGYLRDLLPGSLVALHWDWVCDVITPRQASNLERYTLHHIALANETL